MQMGGAAVLGVGVWTVVEKSDYLSLLASSTFAVSAYILILAGSLVVVTGFLGCCAVIREQRSCLSTVRQEGLETHAKGVFRNCFLFVIVVGCRNGHLKQKHV